MSNVWVSNLRHRLIWLAVIAAVIAVACTSSVGSGVGADAPSAESLREYRAPDAIYNYDVCERAFDDEETQRYCFRDELGDERPQLTFDCGALTSKELQQDCDWDRAIVTGDASICDLIEGDGRDICLWDVASASVSRGAPPTLAGVIVTDPIELCDLIGHPGVRDGCLNHTRTLSGPE